MQLCQLEVDTTECQHKWWNENLELEAACGCPPVDATPPLCMTSHCVQETVLARMKVRSPCPLPLL